MTRISTIYFPAPFGHFEARIDRRDPRPAAVVKSSFLRRGRR
jgi:hypothetical protein